MTDSTHSRPYHLYRIAIIGVWLIVLALSLLLLLQGEVSRVRDDFRSSTGKLLHAVSDRVVMQEISLEGFANFIASMPQLDLDRARVFARRWRERFPEIYMLEIVQRLDHARRADFVQEMRAKGYAGFEIHTFGYESDRRVHLSPDKDVYYPVVFIEPELPEAKGVLGLDLSDTSSVLKNALEHSYAQQRLVASSPFDLLEGRRGYVMYRPLVDMPSEAMVELALEQELYALIVVDARTLIPDWVRDHRNLYVSLSYRNNADGVDERLVRVDTTRNDAGFLNRILPTFEQSERIESVSQPFVVTMRYKVGWGELNLGLFVLFIVVAVITFMIAKSFEHLIVESRLEKDAERQRLNILANYDNITGLPNRMLLLDRIEQAIRRAVRQQTRFAVVFIDLNDFKSVNDRYGHEAGNRLLKSVARRLIELMREEDTVARIHGDEFVIVLNDVHADMSVEVVSKKLAFSFRSPIEIEGHAIEISASVGHAVFPDDGATAEALLSVSDKQMYKEKRRSKIRVV